MIRLIATDLDGTLLDDQKRIPEEFFPTVKALEGKTTFVVASGRSYPKVEQDFMEGLKQLYFICDNGAAVWHQGRLLQHQSFSREELAQLIEELQKIPHILAILCGVKGVYHLDGGEEFERDLRSYYINDHVVQDLNQVEDEILKLAVCDLQGPENNSYPRLKDRFGEQFHLAISGRVWVDIMPAGINKGRALASLQRELGVSREETMAFGDFYNDVELLAQAEYSYVMENADQDMKQYGKRIAPSNNQNGVMRVIGEQFPELKIQ